MLREKRAIFENYGTLFQCWSRQFDFSRYPCLSAFCAGPMCVVAWININILTYLYSVFWYVTCVIEFVLLMSVFNTLSETALAEFLFVILTDRNYILSALGEEESLGNMEHLIKELFGNAWGNETKITKILSRMGAGQSISSDLFVKYCVSNKSLLHMPMTHQLAIR